MYTRRVDLKRVGHAEGSWLCQNYVGVLFTLGVLLTNLKLKSMLSTFVIFESMPKVCPNYAASGFVAYLAHALICGILRRVCARSHMVSWLAGWLTGLPAGRPFWLAGILLAGLVFFLIHFMKYARFVACFIWYIWHTFGIWRTSRIF